MKPVKKEGYIYAKNLQTRASVSTYAHRRGKTTDNLISYPNNRLELELETDVKFGLLRKPEGKGDDGPTDKYRTPCAHIYAAQEKPPLCILSPSSIERRDSAIHVYMYI